MGNISCGLGSLRRSSSKRKRKTSNNHSSPTESTQNVVHSDPQPSESEVYNVWYRHTGEELPSDYWWDSYNYHRSDEKRSARQILENVGEQDITHLFIKYKLPSSLKDIAPNLTHLSIYELEDHSQLDSLRELTELKVLYLDYNDFSSGLPSVIGELKSLTELFLLDCKLTDLPENLRELKELKVLHLYHNDFSNGLPSVIGELKSLVELHLTRSKLTDLPDNIRELKQLKILHLDDADFSKGLPKVITELTSLTELSLAYCHLTSLPPSMSELNRLKVLQLGGNDFSKGLPDIIPKLTSLTELSLQRSHLPSLPQGFGMLQQLEVLDLESGIYSLDGFSPETLDSMSELKRLKILKLGGHDFSSGLPEVIPQLTSLTELSLTNCLLTSLPSRIGQLQQLEKLDLKGNHFSNGLSNEIGDLNSLTQLDLADCSLTDLPQRIGQLQQLEKLKLMGNNFSNGLSNEIGDLNSLTELDLADCSLTDLPQRFDKLQQLQKLHLYGNNFLNGLPDVITKLHSLTQLYLGNCSLTDLPPSLVNLERLRELDSQHNKLKRIPSVIYKLKELESLDVSYNSELVEMDNGILQLEKLQRIELCGTSLPSPLGVVALQGLELIKKYFLDLEKEAAVNTIPVAIIGEARAGKTCIRKSLVSGKRVLFDRSSSTERATEVFEVKTLKLETSEVNLIDFGGQDIYQVAYQLAVKERCVPLLVVHMAKYKELIDQARCEEQATKRQCMEEQATKRLCMEWLCHLYVAQPNLRRPMLALTHIDELSSREEFEELKDKLLQSAGKIQKKWLEREKRLSDEKRLEREKRLSDEKRLEREKRLSDAAPKSDGNSERISCIEKLKFMAEDIFEFTRETESSDIKALTNRIESQCIGEIPQHWKDVGDYLKNCSGPYIERSAVAKKFGDYKGILRYLHDSGAILWFDQKKELEGYVFHRTKAVTEMVALLFPLDKEKMETECIDSFSGCFDERKEEEIGITKYKQFLENYLYKTAGMIDEAFLCHRVETQTKFKFSIAKDLLMCFRIIHGPIQLTDDSSPRTVYLVPSFMKKPLDKPWETPDKHKLQLRLDLIFNGLPLPKHVYQLMTVEVLNLKEKDEHVEAYSNGAEVVHEKKKSVTYLAHDYDHQKVTVLVSTNVAHLKQSWDNLKVVTDKLKHWLNEEWPACLVELETYCAHCLFRKDPEPGSSSNPAWHTADEKEPNLLRERNCLKSTVIDVPTAFLMPCSVLNKTQIAKLKGYLTKWQCEPFDADMRQDVKSTEKHGV